MVLFLQAGISPCGGALVASKYVVTAAHCLYFDVDSTIPKVPSDINITLGEHDLSIKGEGTLDEKTVGVAKIFRHEKYDSGTMVNDIAVLELSEDVDMETYTPVCMAKTSDSKSFYGKPAKTYGWGTTTFGGKKSNILRTVTLPVVGPSNLKCQESMEEHHVGKICAGGLGKDACQVTVKTNEFHIIHISCIQGDSGGPLTTNHNRNKQHTLIGVTSYGKGVCATVSLKEGLKAKYYN